MIASSKDGIIATYLCPEYWPYLIWQEWSTEVWHVWPPKPGLHKARWNQLTRADCLNMCERPNAQSAFRLNVETANNMDVCNVMQSGNSLFFAKKRQFCRFSIYLSVNCSA